MDLKHTFPSMYYLNLATRQDRRVRCEEVFASFGLEVKRFPAVNAAFVRNPRRFESAGRYAHAVSTRMIIRNAMHEGAPAVFIFEDDVILDPNLHERLADIELPEDWGMFYLGCQHHLRPRVVGDGLVRIRGGLDTHAWGIRGCQYRKVMRVLDGRLHPVSQKKPPADVFLARLHEEVPSYATFPNLAWQAEEHSDLVKGVFSNYHQDGSQGPAQEATTGIMAGVLGAKPWFGLPKTLPLPFYSSYFRDDRDCEASADGSSASDANAGPAASIRHSPPLTGPGRIAFLFLTVGEHRHGEIWEQYWASARDSVALYAHTKGVDQLKDSWLKEAQIRDNRPTQWAHVTVLRAQLAMLRAALKDGRNKFFAFTSESCVPIRPLDDLLRLLAHDGRSRFGYDTFDEAEEKHPQKLERAEACRTIPSRQFLFHSQWVFLNREAAELVVEDDLTGHFEDVFSPDEEYFGTILGLKGFPLDSRVARKDMTWTSWPDSKSPNPDTHEVCSPELAGDLASSGCYFARKFSEESDIARFGLHI